MSMKTSPIDWIGIVIVYIAGFIGITAKIVLIAVGAGTIVIVSSRIVIERVNVTASRVVSGGIVMSRAVSGREVHVMVGIFQPVLVLIFDEMKLFVTLRYVRRNRRKVMHNLDRIWICGYLLRRRYGLRHFASVSGYRQLLSRSRFERYIRAISCWRHYCNRSFSRATTSGDHGKCCCGNYAQNPGPYRCFHISHIHFKRLRAACAEQTHST